MLDSTNVQEFNFTHFGWIHETEIINTEFISLAQNNNQSAVITISANGKSKLTRNTFSLPKQKTAVLRSVLGRNYHFGIICRKIIPIVLYVSSVQM